MRLKAQAVLAAIVFSSVCSAYGTGLAYLGHVMDTATAVVGVRLLRGAEAAAQSPDGRHVYVAGCNDQAIVWFTCAAATGALTFAGSVKDGLGGVDGLRYPVDVKVSPDGRHVYVASYGSPAVTWFSRDSATGDIQYGGCVKDTGSVLGALHGPQSVAVSPDGNNVYVTSPGGSTVAWFSREPSTGSLTYVDKLTEGVGGVTGLGRAYYVAAARNGRHVYIAADSGGYAASLFIRDTATGTLTYDRSFSAQSGVVGSRFITLSPDESTAYVVARDLQGKRVLIWLPRDAARGTLGKIGSGMYEYGDLQGALRCAVSPDSSTVYSAGNDNVTWFARDRSTGALAYVGRVSRGDVLQGATSVIVGVGATHVYATAGESNAVSWYARIPSTGALIFAGGVKPDTSRGLGGVRGLAVSPDGRHVYAAATKDDSVSWYSRGPSTGLLEFGGVVGGLGLDGASWATVSPDGNHVYVTGSVNGAITWFTRNPVAGSLVYGGSLFDGVGGVDGLSGARHAVLSPDGGRVYVTGETDNAIAWFIRNSATGALTYGGSIADGTDGVDELGGIRSTVLSPDGKHLYAVASIDDALTWFTLDESTGAPAYGGSVSNVVAGMGGVFAAAVSPDGNHVYALLRGLMAESELAWYDRDTSDGSLAYGGTVPVGFGALGPACDIAVGSDGSEMYVVSDYVDTIAWFTCNPTSGALTQSGSFTDDNSLHLALRGTQCVVVSPDGNNVYAAAATGKTIEMFRVLGVPVVLTSPNGGEVWEMGSVQNITWTSMNNTNVRIEYNPGSGWEEIAATVPAYTGLFEWSVPDLATTTGAVVRVSDLGGVSNDQSDSSFTIRERPTSAQGLAPASMNTFRFSVGGQAVVLATALRDINRVRIMDLGGRVVAELRVESSRAAWDSCVEADRIAHGGVYVVRLMGKNASECFRVTKVSR